MMGADSSLESRSWELRINLSGLGLINVLWWLALKRCHELLTGLIVVPVCYSVMVLEQ